MAHTRIHTDKGPRPAGPYSQAIVAGNTIYVAGQGALDPATGKLVSGGIEAEARQTFENIRAILAAAGATMSDVVKVTVYLADLDDFASMNGVYKQFFSEPYPARATVGAKLLFNTLIEVDCTAVKTS